jgi:hypothetical protein
MFLTLLLVTFLIAFIVSFIVTVIFKKPFNAILHRIVDEEIGQAWSRYLTFAIYVVGISTGVRVWDLEKYITPIKKDSEIILLNLDRWVLEVYRTIIGTLQGIAWMLLVFFIFSLLAYVIVRIFEGRDVRAK